MRVDSSVCGMDLDLGCWVWVHVLVFLLSASKVSSSTASVVSKWYTRQVKGQFCVTQDGDDEDAMTGIGWDGLGMSDVGKDWVVMLGGWGGWLVGDGLKQHYS